VVHEPDTLLLDSGGFGSNVIRKGNTFLRPLKKKGCKEARVASIRWDNLSTSTTLESNKSHVLIGVMPIRDAVVVTDAGI